MTDTRQEMAKAIDVRKRLQNATRRRSAAEKELAEARNEWELALLEAQPYYTYDNLAVLSGRSRIRIAQVLREVRARHVEQAEKAG